MHKPIETFITTTMVCYYLTLFSWVHIKFLQYCAKKLARKNVSKMTYFMWSGT